MGISSRLVGTQSGQRRENQGKGRTLVDQPSFEWRADPAADNGTPSSGVLLPEPGAGTRPRQPAIDDRRSLVTERVFSNETVKDVPGHFVNHVMGLDTKDGLNGPPVRVSPCEESYFNPSTRYRSASMRWYP